MTNGFSDYEFVSVFLSCSLIFLLCTMFIKSILFRKISVTFFGIFFALAAVEIGLSLSMDKYVESYRFETRNTDKIITLRGLHFYDSKKKKHKLEFELKNDVNNHNDEKDEKREYIYNATYNCYTNGLRYTKCNLKSDKAYVFLGCSMVFGEGLNDDKTLPYYFSKLTNFENNIINCGVRGHGTNTALSLLDSDIINYYLKGAKTEYFFYSLIDDHIYRNFRTAVPGDCWLYTGEKWLLSNQPFGKMKYILKRSYIFRKIFLDIIDCYNKNFYINYLIDSLKQMDKIIREKYNSNLIIIKWRSSSDILVKELQKANLKFILLPSYNEENGYIIKNDGHPAAKANEEIARILYNKINFGG
ncbi:MAG: hypothetical protein WC234_00675 [Endomicrobiaceae bacterium]